MENTTKQQLKALPVAAGDMFIEAIGAEVRFWQVLPDGRKLRRIGTSCTMLRCGRSLVNYDDAGKMTLTSAIDLTVTRIYNRKDPAAGAALVRRYLPEVTGALHFCYSGCGPSGQRWGFSNDSRYTIPK